MMQMSQLFMEPEGDPSRQMEEPGPGSQESGVGCIQSPARAPALLLPGGPRSPVV